jgi:glucose-1-phosphate cytidylyltransferase
VVILAGGLGTRLAEETEVKPKPMVEIGARPLLWHIMKHYAHFGLKQFVVALGYRGDVIKRFFVDYHSLNGSLTVNLVTGRVQRNERHDDDWEVQLMDTGHATNTGGRVKRLQPLLSDGTFMVTYGDGVCNVDLSSLLGFHRAHGRIATVTAVRPPARFGGLIFDGDLVAQFTEKPQIGEGWINGGYMVFEPSLFDYLEGDDCSLEADALERLAADRQLAAFRHDGFWQCMDTLRDKRLLESLWQGGRPPWRVWE